MNSDDSKLADVQLTDASSHLDGFEQSERDMAFALLHASPTFYVAIDALGRVRLMNSAMLDALGYTLSEVIGKSYIPMFVPLEDQSGLSAVFERLVRENKPTFSENHVLTKSGKRLLVEWHGRQVFKDGKLDYFFGVGIDITARNEAQEALKRNEDLSRRVLECVPGGIVHVSPDGLLLKANLEAQRFLGLSYDAILQTYVADFKNKTIWEDGTPCDPADYPVSRALKTGMPQSAATIGVLRPDGTTNWGVFSAIPLADSATGKLTGVVVTFLDITQRRKEERERLALERKLLETQKLESLGILAGGIAHDFNNLLAGILGNANLASMQVSGDSAIRPFLESIEESTRVAAKLCAQMLAYAGRGRTLVQPISIPAMIEEMTQLLSIFVGERIDFAQHLAPDLPTVTADATQLRQVLLNLVINAAEAIGENDGTIRIDTGRIDADADYLKKTHLAPDLEPGVYVYIDVTDNGCGMDAETLARIFDPFFTTKFTGRGLGLAAVLGIIRSHKGAINVESAPGKGAAFRVLLPASN